MLRLSGLIVLMAGVTACGAATNRAYKPADGATVSSTTTAGSSTNDVSTTGDVQLDGGFFFLMVFDGGKSPSPESVYGVFRRPANEDDRAAAQTARSSGVLTGLGGPEPDYSKGRLMEGTPQTGIFAVPMPDDTVCIAQLPEGGGGCGSVSAHGLTADYDEGYGGDPFRMYGLAGDEVQGIDLVLSGIPHAATVGANGYELSIPGGRAEDIDQIIIHLRSGARDVIDLSGLRLVPYQK